MNAKLVESLAEAVSALSSEDYSLFQSALLDKSIQKTAGVCGGLARVRNTRIAAWTLISLMEQGESDAAILVDFPGLTSFDLVAVRQYHRAHPNEIKSEIASHHDEAGAEFMVQEYFRK